MILLFKATAISMYLIVIAAFANDAALTTDYFKSLSNDINRDPHPVYLQLLDIEKNKQTLLKSDTQLWLLYRKAHSENLLYFYDDFEKTVTKASALMTEQSDIEIRAGLNYFLGLVAERKGQYKASLSYLLVSMDISRKTNLSELYVLAKRESAYVLTLQENYEASLNDMQEAYVEAFALNDHFLIAVINEVYGAIYGYMDDYEKSIDYYQKALDTYERLGYQPYAAEAIYGIATTYRYWKKYDLAIQKFTQYRDKISFTPNKDISFFGEYGLAVTYAELGQCGKALKTIEYALKLAGLQDYNAELYKHKASCLISIGSLNEAEQALEKAFALYNGMPELEGTTWQLSLIKVKGNLLYAQGDIEQGYKKLKQYYEAYTKLLISNSSQKILKIRETMDLERLDIEISALKQREKVQSLLVEQQEQKIQQQYILSLLGFCFIVFVLLVVYLQYKNNKKVLDLSITDPLTGVFNRRYIFEYLDKLVLSVTGERGALSVLLFDIDDFKQVNDEYGHPFGDHVLKQVAEITQAELRTGDLLGRIGGEEFICILPRTDNEMASKIAERLKEVIMRELFITSDDDRVFITISIGISALGEDAIDRASLYIQSDKALYKAKQQGKNQVVVYSPKFVI